MGRQVPAVERALDVLELLADHPDETLGLSEIARRLDPNKASCHAVVTLLSDRGYLLRRAGKTYSLGPSILPLAKTFLTEHDALLRARAEMTALSRDLGLDSVASTVVDDETVVLAIANSPASLVVHVRAGSRFALVPPVGTVFLAWAGPEGIQRWRQSRAVGECPGARALHAGPGPRTGTRLCRRVRPAASPQRRRCRPAPGLRGVRAGRDGSSTAVSDHEPRRADHRPGGKRPVGDLARRLLRADAGRRHPQARQAPARGDGGGLPGDLGNVGPAGTALRTETRDGCDTRRAAPAPQRCGDERSRTTPSTTNALTRPTH